MDITLDDLREQWSLAALTPVDLLPADKLTEHQKAWRDNGYLILPKFMPTDVIDAYCDEWRSCNGMFEDPGTNRVHGFADAVAYMNHQPVRDLFCHDGLAAVLEEIVGEPMGVHLNLTGWVSTERDWHSDQYLNHPEVGNYYAAMWCALDDIDPASGPFQLIEGSHKWDPLSRAKVLAALGTTINNPDWPWDSEKLLTPLFEKLLADEKVQPWSFIASKGDVLIWSGRLLHRGSKANVPGMERRATIGHFSGISRREDMPKARQATSGGWLFPLKFWDASM